MAITRANYPVFILCLAAAVSAVTKIQTISIHSPTSGAVLNPVGAAINTKLQAKLYGNPYIYGQYSPYGGIGLGAGLAGYAGAVVSPLAISGYGAILGGYGGVPSYQYGYPGLPGSYTVKTIYPPGKKYGGISGYSYGGVYPNIGGYSYGGVYPNIGGYSYGGVSPNIGGYSYGFAGTYPSAVGLAGSQYGGNQIGYSHAPGYLTYSAVNKLAGYGQ